MGSVNPDVLKESILEHLKTVIDPETGVDVVRMRLVEDLKVNESGLVSYIFRPSSPLCPIAVPLAMQIMEAVRQVEGVVDQDIRVEGYAAADSLNELLKDVS